MISVTAPKHPTVSAAERADMAMLLARSVRRRREQLGLSVQRAAELSGMDCLRLVRTGGRLGPG